MIGLGDTALTVWSIAKWPVLALIVVLVVALLYYATPNVQQPKFRWISVGAGVAILIWVLASVGFAFYVGNFSSYNKTYGSLAGVIVDAAVPVDHQPGAAVRGRARRRARARPAAAGGHRGRGGAPAPGPRHPQHQEGPQEAGQGHRARSPASAARRRRPTRTTRRVEGLAEGEIMIIKRLPLLIAGGIGYVLGAKAGRERYDQLRVAVRQGQERPAGAGEGPAGRRPGQGEGAGRQGQAHRGRGCRDRQGEVGDGRRPTTSTDELNPDRLKLHRQHRPAGQPALTVQ